jgi:hypothetical protein
MNVRGRVPLRWGPGCYCKSLNCSAGHYRKSELEDFLGNMSRYGVGRRIFGTYHSLGLGPMGLEDWDEVWMLEGSRVPFILRRVDDHYRLVGACYVHAFDRKIHCCIACSGETIQQDITSRLMRDPAVQVTTRDTNYDAMKPDQLYIVTLRIRERESGMKLSPWIGWTQYTWLKNHKWWYWEIATTCTQQYPPTDCPLRSELQEITIR